MTRASFERARRANQETCRHHCLPRWSKATDYTDAGVNGLSLHSFLKKLFAAGLLPDKVGYRMATRMAMETDDTARRQRALAERSLMDRGYAISCTAASTLRKIGDNIQGNIKGANEIWMHPARNPCEQGAFCYMN
ncbi:hypothetical protein MTO96_016778 [Rhipicephalus appendiculatus]